jgi:predicted acylesterase/phospholipase RssA
MHRVFGRRRRVGIFCAAVLAALSVQACSLTRLGPQPAELTTKAVVIDTPNARFFPVEQIDAVFEEGVRSVEREMRARNITDPNKLPPANFLAISGGGDDGAFGAGLLVGWTESGQRPEFKMVTGVSTGALIAPFAFLGPAYDEKLKEVYTKISKKDIFFDRWFTAAFFDDALADTSPLFQTISRLLNEDMLHDIAREYEKGRLLMIGTTYLDARRPVIWNIGAIAASKNPKALELIRKILLASSAIPGAFPPVMIDVDVDGRHYQEMHVDGGAMAQLFLYPPQLGSRITDASVAGVNVQRERHAYIIRNARLGLDWSAVERATLDIAGRAISTMIYVSGLNDLFRVYTVTQRDGVDFNLAYIDDDFAAPPHEEDFDPTYMNALFGYGYAQARRGYAWKKGPPGIEGRATRR